MVTVTTENAVYAQYPGSHLQPSQLPDTTLSAMDALVVENGVTSYDELTIDDLLQTEQYGTVLDACSEHGEGRVYAVDVPYRCSDTAVYLSEVCGKLGIPLALGVLGVVRQVPSAGVLALPALSLSLGGQHAVTDRLAGYAQLSNGYNSFGFRSAVAAEKLDTFVAPRLREELDRKPQIVIDYGAGHLDIAAYLQHPRLRRGVITFHDRMGRGLTDEAHVDKVCAFRQKDGVWRKQVHTTAF